MFKPAKHSAFNTLRLNITSQISHFLKSFGISQKQLIVCGYPRSGTSLLYNMLSTTLYTKFKFADFENYFMFNIHKLGNIASKAPLDIMHIEYLDELNIHKKNISLIIVIRDIREILTSRHPVFPDSFFIGSDHSYWPQDKEFKSWAYTAPGIIDISDKIRTAQLKPYAITIKYEDLVNRPNYVQKTLSSFYGFKFDLLFSDYHKKPGKMSYRYTGRYKARDSGLVLEGKKIKQKVPRWRNEAYRDRIIEQFTSNPELFELLIEYGYEKDRNWFNNL